MHRTDSTDAATKVLRSVFPAVIFLGLSVSGCGYSCYSGFWNGNQSGVGFSNTSCPLAKAMGAVTVQVSAASTSSGASAAFPSLLASQNRSVEHIFVTLRGIEAQPADLANAESSGWQELAPDLATHPVQLDLLSSLLPVALTADSQSLSSPSNANVPATVPADEYRQLRIRLASPNPSSDDLLPESNACGKVGQNCIIFADGSVWPLQFEDVATEFHVTPEDSTDGVFRVLPGEVIHLSIEFDPASSAFFASNGAVRLVPAFQVISRRSSPDGNTH